MKTDKKLKRLAACKVAVIARVALDAAGGYKRKLKLHSNFSAHAMWQSKLNLKLGSRQSLHTVIGFVSRSKNVVSPARVRKALHQPCK